MEFTLTTSLSEATAGGLTAFYLDRVNDLYDNNVFREIILEYREYSKGHIYCGSDREDFASILLHYLEEAELTLSLLRRLQFTESSKILEVGGGLGFIHGYLRTLGHQLYSIEPSQSGFAAHDDGARQLLRTVGVDATSWYPLEAADCARIGENFDIIFSHNVLEHIRDLEQAMSALVTVLKPDGIMIHHTVNYLVPYEPHFKMLLVPMYPRLTERLNPGLANSELWKGLNFVTATRLRRMSQSMDVDIKFERGILSDAFARFESDPEFGRRHRSLARIYRVLKRLHLLVALRYVPISLTTPIRFTMTKSGSSRARRSG